MRKHRLFYKVLVSGVILALLVASAPVFASASPQTASIPSLDPDTQFYVPKPNHGAVEQIAELTSIGDKADAYLINEMIETPQAVWFTGGDPHQVQQDVKNTVQRAAGKKTVPTLVAYNLPFRDCSQYSAGGALSIQDYMAWIDGFAAGIGDNQAVVILEPDGLGIIPYNIDINGNLEWCQPADADPATAASDRYQALNYAVDRLGQQPNVDVYLDGTHSRWLGVGDIAHRLVLAGAQRATGFFLNVSNYQPTEHLQKYGTWIAKCIWFASDPGSWGNGHYDWCASQYYPANVDDFSTWTLTDQWYTDNVESQTWVPYPGDEGLTRFVIDTSRNGQGRWVPPSDIPPGDPQDWCNPPDRGLGYRPTADTGQSLIDAYLWVKIPGESDGECYRWTSGPLDPIRGIQDPAAGQWFPDMALELVHNANPPLP
jgi:endoglucanase